MDTHFLDQFVVVAGALVYVDFPVDHGSVVFYLIGVVVDHLECYGEVFGFKVESIIIVSPLVIDVVQVNLRPRLGDELFKSQAENENQGGLQNEGQDDSDRAVNLSTPLEVEARHPRRKTVEPVKPFLGCGQGHRFRYLTLVRLRG